MHDRFGYLNFITFYSSYEPPYMLVAHSRYISVIDMEGNVLNNSIVRDEHGILSIDYHFRYIHYVQIRKTTFSIPRNCKLC